MIQRNSSTLLRVRLADRLARERDVAASLSQVFRRSSTFITWLPMLLRPHIAAAVPLPVDRWLPVTLRFAVEDHHSRGGDGRRLEQMIHRQGLIGTASRTVRAVGSAVGQGMTVGLTQGLVTKIAGASSMFR
jgi:hypothetical protein